MKKKLLVIMIIFLMTGCTANYNLTIKDDNFIESIDISTPVYNKDELTTLIENDQFVKSTLSSDIIYEKNVTDDGNNINVNLKHTYSLGEYNESAANKCFENFRVQEDSDFYTIVADKFSCYGGFEQYAEKYKINIKTDYSVINSNADSIKGNVYTWNIDKNNHEKKSIIFQFSKKEKDIDFNNIFKVIGISFLCALLILIVIKLIFDYKKKQTMEM